MRQSVLVLITITERSTKERTFEDDPRESLIDDMEESLPEVATTERTRFPAAGSQIRDPAEKEIESVDLNDEGNERWREALMAEEWSDIMVEMRRWVVLSPESVG